MTKLEILTLSTSSASIIGLILSIIYNYINGKMLKKESKKLEAAVRILDNLNPTMKSTIDPDTGGRTGGVTHNLKVEDGIKIKGSVTGKRK